MSIRFFVSEKAIPQPRHRVGKGWGDHPRAYIKGSHPVHTFKQIIQRDGRLAMGRRPLLSGPLAFSILFALPRPKSYRKSEVYEWRSTKPDLDNLQKSILDALKSIIYTDDSVIVSARCLKVTVPSGVKAGIYIGFDRCGEARESVDRFLSAFLEAPDGLSF